MALLDPIPPTWRLVHLGQNSAGEWSCELTRSLDNGQSWQCASSRKMISAQLAIEEASLRAERAPEHRSIEPGVFVARILAVAPLSVEDL